MFQSGNRSGGQADEQQQGAARRPGPQPGPPARVQGLLHSCL